MTIFPVRRNAHAPSSPAGEILIFAAPDGAEWATWMCEAIIGSDNPALAGIAVCTAVPPYTSHASYDELLWAARRVQRVVFPSTAQFGADGPHREAFGIAWRRTRGPRDCVVIPVAVDDYEPGGLLASSMTIRLGGTGGSDDRTKFTTELGYTIVPPALPALPPPYPG